MKRYYLILVGMVTIRKIRNKSVSEGVEIGNTCALFVGANTNGVSHYGKLNVH